MKFDFKGVERNDSRIKNLICLLKEVDENQIWLFNGLEVVLDPTVDYKIENILIRWTDINEGFNDKILVYSLEEFQTYFKLADA